MNIGKNIKTYRIKKDLNISQLSFRCGIAREVISKIEKGQYKNPTLSTIEKVAVGLGVEPYQLLKPQAA